MMADFEEAYASAFAELEDARAEITRLTKQNEMLVAALEEVLKAYSQDTAAGIIAGIHRPLGPVE
jgi:hypothetical protein